VNYTGSWNVSYSAYNTGVKNVNGSFSGTGVSKEITIDFQAYGLSAVTACFAATKQDSSNQTLEFTVGSYVNSTSIPYGSVKYCFTEVFA
jgi:hypothetical protein